MSPHHTPGPWHASKAFRLSGRAPGIDIGAENGANIGTAHFDKVDRDQDETRANASLIAAAPDLLTAVRSMLNLYVSLVESGDCGFWDPGIHPEVQAARAAIAKAEARS